MTIKYDHLLGRKFVYGKTDCYDLLRQFYIDNFGITLPNYARPKVFWENGLNLYYDKYAKNGFYPLSCHPSEYQAGDVILCSIQSMVPNHVGVLVEGGKVLHHLWNRLSAVDPYGSLLRNTTMAVMRHRDVTVEQTSTNGSILDYVDPRVRRKLDDLAATAGISADPV